MTRPAPDELPAGESAAQALDVAESDRLRGRLIDWMAWLLAITSLGALGARLLLGPVETASTLLTVGFAAGLLTVPLVARRMRSLGPAAVLLVALLLGLVVSVSYVAGGLDAPILTLLPVVAAVAVPVLGGRRGWIAVGAIMAVLFGFLYLHAAGHGFEQRLSPSGYHQARALMLIIASALLVAVVMTYQRQNEWLRGELRAQASRDPLTGLANRRYSAAALSYAWAHAAREGRPISVILFDVDHFKMYNDTLGHQAGDACLREIADLSRGCIRRATDLVSRHGGEEFLAILPAAGEEVARGMAEELRSTLERRRISHPGAPGGIVTISVGFATALDAGAMGSDALIQQADEALYRAKAGGRNRVEGWCQGEPAPTQASASSASSSL